MKIVLGNHKTTDIIKMAARNQTYGYISCMDETEVQNVVEYAHRVEAIIRHPITFDELATIGRGTHPCPNVYIDNAEYFLQRSAPFAHVEAASFRIPEHELMEMIDRVLERHGQIRCTRGIFEKGIRGNRE